MSGMTNQSLASRTTKPTPQPQHEPQTIQTINISNSTVTINGNCQTMAAEHNHVATPAPKPVKDNGSCTVNILVTNIMPDSILTFNGINIPYSDGSGDPLSAGVNVASIPIENGVSFGAPIYVTGSATDNGKQPNPLLTTTGLEFYYLPDQNYANALQFNIGTQLSTFNFYDIHATIYTLDKNRTPLGNGNQGGGHSEIAVTDGNTPVVILTLNDFINFFNSGQFDSSVLNIYIIYKKHNTYTIPNVYTFTNNSPFPVNVTCQNGFTLALAANGGFGTGTQIISEFDNSNPLTNQDTITWTFTGIAYKCTSQMQLNTTNNGLGNVFTVGNANEISTAINFMGSPLAADIYGNFAVSQATMNLPAGTDDNGNYTYDIVFGLNPSTPCVYTLNVTNNTSNVMLFNSASGPAITSTTFTTQITVPGYESVTTNLLWPKLTQWGGPSTIIVSADKDGNGTIQGIDRGAFDTDPGVTYEPKMVATVSGQLSPPNPFSQNANGFPTQWNTYTTIPPTGCIISLVFTDS